MVLHPWGTYELNSRYTGSGTCPDCRRYYERLHLHNCWCPGRAERVRAADAAMRAAAAEAAAGAARATVAKLAAERTAADVASRIVTAATEAATSEHLALEVDALKAALAARTAEIAEIRTRVAANEIMLEVARANVSRLSAVRDRVLDLFSKEPVIFGVEKRAADSHVFGGPKRARFGAE